MNYSAANYPDPIDIYTTGDFNEDFVFYDANGVDLLPVTGATAKAGMRQKVKVGVTPEVLQFDQSGEVTVVSVDSTVQIRVNYTRLGTLPTGLYHFDIRLTFPTGADIVMFRAILNLVEGVAQ